MSFTVIVKDNKTGKFLYTSEEEKALILGVIGAGNKPEQAGCSLALCHGHPVDAIMSIGLAKEAIESIEEQDPAIKMCSQIAGPLMTMRHARRSKSEENEDVSDD